LVKPLFPKDVSAQLKKYQGILANRTAEQEIVGMILHREMTMKIGNQPEIVSKVADRLVKELSGRIPPRDRLGVHLGLVEMIMNAVEHGNLGITYDEKTAAMEGPPGAFEKLIAERQFQEPFKSRSVLIHFEMDRDSCEWTITDEGNGFDWKSVPDPNDPENLLSAHGR